MDDDTELRDEDLPEELRRSREASTIDLNSDGGHDHQNGEEEPPEPGEAPIAWEWRPPPAAASHEAKLRELLRDLCSPEAQIHSEASKQFVALLRGDSGGDALLEYVRGSPRCSELTDAWNLRRGKPGMPHHLSLIAAVLGHPLGKSRAGGIFRNIDGLARLIVTSKLEDLYAELKSEEGKRHAAALTLLAALVRRGAGLASEVAKTFDFRLPVLPKLAGVQKTKGGREAKRRPRRSTRRAFVEFAVSFLEVGNPRLLRWILQQKEMYSGVLRGLGGDDLETVVYVLSTLRDKVLCADSLVPPGLRSVLFGSATLEQLSFISGNPDGGEAADVAHEVLVRVCTEPCNGLMPGESLKGNVKRLCDLMKKLKATESRKHRDLLLAIVKGRPFLCSLYMDEFPYHLEPRASPLWYSAISLAADLISAVNFAPSFSFLAASKSSGPPSLDSVEVQCILKCIVPRSFTRSVINKGLLHSDDVVKHGSLRLLLEALRLLDSLNDAIEGLLDNLRAKHSALVSGETGLSCWKSFQGFEDAGICPDGQSISIGSTDGMELQKWVSLKENIQDEVRSYLPDPQVLLKLLTSFANKNSETSRLPLKRCTNSPHTVRKKLKSDADKTDGEVDIVLSVIDSELISDVPEAYSKVRDVDDMDTERKQRMAVAEIWGVQIDTIIKETENVTTLFHAKLLDVLKFYLRTLPLTLEGSFDFIKILPSNPTLLSVNQQEAMLSLLIEYVGQAPERKASNRVPDMMYKSLQPLISLLIFSPVRRIQNQAFTLAQVAMLSTGAFDCNLSEIDSWFLFLPGYDKDKYSKEFQVTEEVRHLSTVVISFLCDAVSTVGNNLYKYLDHMRVLVSKLDGHEDFCPDFSPLIICILQKCIRVLESDSGTFKLHERSMISLYVRNTLSFILQSQVDMKILPCLVSFILNEKLNGSCSADGDNCRRSLCEWRLLNDLLLLAQSIFHQQACDPFLSLTGRISRGNVGSFLTVACKVRDFLEHDDGHGLVAVATAMCFSIVCTTPDDLLENFPMLLATALHVPQVHIRFLSSILLQREFLGNAANRWPDMCFLGLDKVASRISKNLKDIDAYQNGRASSTPGRGGLISASDVDSIESLAVAFSLILEHASFYAIFYGVMNSCSCSLFKSNKMLDVLHAKLEEESISNCILSLHVVLFWAHQIRSCYRTQQSGDLEQMFEFCSSLISYILDKILVQPCNVNTLKWSNTPITADYILEVVDIIFHHPIVTLSITHPLCFNGNHSQQFMGDNLEAFLESSKQYIHLMDYHVLCLFTRLGEFMLGFGNGKKFTSNVSVSFPESILKAFIDLLQQSVSLFKEKFDLYIMTKDVGSVFPIFYIFCSVMRFISPFELMELVDWMFCKIGDDLDHWVSKRASACSVCFYVTNIALEIMYNFLHQTNTKACWWLWESRNRTFSVSILQNVYCKIVDYAILFKSDSADLCLLKAVNAIYTKNIMQNPAALPVNIPLCRIIMSSPMKLITHCIYETNKVKARTLFELIEVSPLHLSLFGMSFLCLIKELSSADISNIDGAWPPKVDMITGKHTSDFPNEDLLLLLPASLSFLTSVFCKFRKQDLKLFECIPSFYSRIILKVFCNWKSYCSGKLFHEDFDKRNVRSVKEFLDCCSSTLLGKTIKMFHFNSILSGGSMKRKHRLHIFDSIFDCFSPYDQLFDCDVGEINPHLYEESYNLVNRAIAKLSFAKLLLFPPRSVVQFSHANVDEDSKESSKKTSSSENNARLRFLNILFDSLDNMVRRFPWNQDHCDDTDCSYMFRFLEIHILRNIVQLSIDIKNYLIQLPSIPFLKPFIRSSLLHRFEDPTTLRAMRILLCTLETKPSCLDILELLLGHSEFVATILWNDHNLDMSSSINTGTLLQPLPSIFKLLNFLSPVQEAVASKVAENASIGSREDQYSLQNRKLELVKLLRVLFHLPDQQKNVCNNDGVNHKELLSLLLSGYSATLAEVDLETLHLIHEIEFIEGSDHKNIAAMDYLWGSSAIKLRQEQRFDQLVPSSKIADFETEDERHRRLFRENISLDSNRCLMTALHFCYDRSKLTEKMSLKNLVQDNVMNTPEHSPSLNVNEVQQYDPIFMLPFSIHTLIRGYLEPVEFVRIGLLAIALVSISSPDEEIRKLGYEVLGIFKAALENQRKSKDVLQLRLLLAYLQNGITETWQKIPPVIAMFAAEASFILLDPSHNKFQIISKFLLRSPKVDLKAVPLFHTLFASDSIHFKANRLWILQLLYVGLNSDDDARIFMRKQLFELLLSFYVSSMSDSGTKVLILQIVKKSVKLHMLASHLVKHHGLLSWLHSVIAFNAEKLKGDQEDFSMKQMESALEVVNNVVSLQGVTEWLKDDALEQLSELSQFLYTLFVGSLKLLKENVPLITSLLGVIILTLRISQKRRIFQPHFTLSIEALLQLCQTIECELKDTRFHPIVQLGLTTILMTMPPPVQSPKDKAKLSKLATWAISAALQSGPDFVNLMEEQQREEPLFSKLLRWITASIILGSVSYKDNERNTCFHLEGMKTVTLQFLLGKVTRKDFENEEHHFHSDENVAAIILHLQYLLGTEYSASPATVSALCLLLSGATDQIGNKSWDEDQRNLVLSLCGKISCPWEAYPSWRWSFYQPWRDLSLEQTDLQKIDEQHSCQILLLLFSNFLGIKSDFQVQLYQDVERSGLFKWERSLLLGDG